jgi:hypothetical protein
MAASIALPTAGLATLLVSGQSQQGPVLRPGLVAPAPALVAPAPDVADEGVAVNADAEQSAASLVTSAPASIHPPARIVRAAPREVPVPVQQLPVVQESVAPAQHQPQSQQSTQPAQPAPTCKADPPSCDCQQPNVAHAPQQRPVARPWHISRHGAPPSMPSAPPDTADPAPTTAAEEEET